MDSLEEVSLGVKVMFVSDILCDLFRACGFESSIVGGWDGWKCISKEDADV